MLIKDLVVHNPKIKFNGIGFNFQQCGINLIRGENGIGKTTILKHILFHHYNVTFPTQGQQNYFTKGRHALFAYVPQDLPLSNVSVKDFLTKGNRRVNMDAIAQYMHEFKFDAAILNAKFNTLSGGEKTKLSIICALAKNTPYVFMDEPTNHLDDTSVQILLGIIQRLSANRTFIIICHDSRFEPKNYNLLEIKNNEVVAPPYEGNNPINEFECADVEKRYVRLAKKYLLTPLTLSLYTF